MTVKHKWFVRDDLEHEIMVSQQVSPLAIYIFAMTTITLTDKTIISH
jgi:hypothetical protein